MTKTIGLNIIKIMNESISKLGEHVYHRDNNVIENEVEYIFDNKSVEVNKKNV